MHARIGWQNLRKSEFLDSGDYYLITGTDFVDGEVDLANCHYVTKDRYDQDSNIQIENGSILITKDGTLGKVAYVKGLEKPATLNAGVFNILIRDKKRVYGKYLFQYLKAPFLLDYVAQKATGGTIKHLNQEILVDFPVVLPDYDEQVLLGDAFDDLDNFITLHQRKYDKLVNIKKSMLEKMFPRDGATVPEIRFSGFTAPWEQRKVGDHCEMFNGDRSAKYPNAQDMVSEGVPFINAGDLVDGHVNLATANKITREKYDDLGGAKLQYGDIVYCLRGTLGKNAYIDNFTEGTVASSLVAIRPKNIDGRYLFHVLNSDIEYRQRIVHDEGAAQPNLSAKSVSEFVMPAPDIDEQRIISFFLDNLSNLITLHQREQCDVVIRVS